jgi:hypothetical protein
MGTTIGRILRVIGIGLLAAAVAGLLGVLFVRDQMSRHRRDLFSSRPLRRLAALGYLAGLPPAVESVRLLRDFVAWERQPLIRSRAVQVVTRLEAELQRNSAIHNGVAG